MDKTSWNLENILPKEKFDLFCDDFVKQVDSFKALFISYVKPFSKDGFIDLINEYIKLTESISIIYSRGSLAEEINCLGEEEKLLKTKAENCYLHYQNTTIPFVHWLKGIKDNTDNLLNDKEAEELFKSIPSLNYYLHRLRKLKKHSLSLEEERIVTHKNISGINTVLSLRALIENGQVYTATINGKKKTFKTNSEISKYFKDSKSENRVNAYNSLYGEYKTNLTKYFQIYQSIVRDWSFESDLRGYNSNISARNFANDIKDETVDTLLKSCEANKNIFNEFFKVKAKELNLKKLSRYDIYAPIGKTEKDITYKEGLDIVFKVFKGFDLELFEIAKSYFEKENVDVYPNKAKRSGAFCANITNKMDPYLLLNYTNTSRDVFVLAHEFGHATHYILSQGQNILNQDAPLTLAETASTFTENLVFDYLYNKETDVNTKKSMLFEKISDAYATISRQAYFVKFELEAHKLLNKGILLEDFNNEYLKNLKSQFEDYVDIPEIFKYEWAHIPHIVNSPFYCYSYSFGNLLSFSLYEKYLENDGSFAEKYKRILRAGGSQNPYELLKAEGFDIENPDFFNSGFKIINKWVEELKKLV